MRYSELAFRYASAIFDLATENKNHDLYFSNLNALEEIFSRDKATGEFVASPLIRASDKEKSLKLAFSDCGLAPEIVSFILLLAKKDRLQLLPEIIAAYQAKADELNKVSRGTVRSSSVLTAKQKEDVERLVQAVTKKKVLLQYSEDKSLIGGLTAQVGSLTFDDSLSSHLRRIKEDLTRRVN